MFFPQLFGIVGEKLVFTKDHQYDDPEDLYDDRYLLEVRKPADPVGDGEGTAMWKGGDVHVSQIIGKSIQWQHTVRCGAVQCSTIYAQLYDLV